METEEITRRMRGLAAWVIACAALLLMLPASGIGADSEETPGVTLHTLASSVRPSGVAVEPDGTVWFTATEYAQDRTIVGHLNPGEEATVFGLPGHISDARSPTIGPDGNVWFVEKRAARIARVTDAGEVARFPLPRGSEPSALASGPDGNLWFTERAAGRIGRITPAGEISHFRLGARSRPAGITAGPDGAVWFTLARADKIGRISTSGRIKLFRLPLTTQPRAIVTGPDGNLWFTEGSYKKSGRKGRNKIGRITPSGVVTQFRVRAPVGTGSIVAGPAGQISFTTGASLRDSQIASITPAGAVTRYVCLSDYCRLPAYGLASDAEGAVWFAAGVPYCSECGGGTVINMTLTWPGQIGRLAP
jgi:virginiamycin B lyase